MGMNQYNVEVATDTPLVTTAETVVATITGIATPRRTNVRINGTATITTGTATTQITMRVRRGPAITDTLIGEANFETISAAAGSTETHEITTLDLGVDLAGATYVLTAQQTAATGNGSAINADLSVEIPD